MTTFEKWSLGLTVFGFLIVASSIYYAARQWLVSEKLLKREVIKDTRAHISDIRSRINQFQTEIIEQDIVPNNVDVLSSDFIPVRLLLNTVEEVSEDSLSEFYDCEMLKQFALPLAIDIWRFWEPVVMQARREHAIPEAWKTIQQIAAQEPNAD